MNYQGNASVNLRINFFVFEKKKRKKNMTGKMNKKKFEEVTHINGASACSTL